MIAPLHRVLSIRRAPGGLLFLHVAYAVRRPPYLRYGGITWVFDRVSLEDDDDWMTVVLVYRLPTFHELLSAAD